MASGKGIGPGRANRARRGGSSSGSAIVAIAAALVVGVAAVVYLTSGGPSGRRGTPTAETAAVPAADRPAPTIAKEPPPEAPAAETIAETPAADTIAEEPAAEAPAAETTADAAPSPPVAAGGAPSAAKRPLLLEDSFESDGLGEWRSSPAIDAVAWSVSGAGRPGVGAAADGTSCLRVALDRGRTSIDLAGIRREFEADLPTDRCLRLGFAVRGPATPGLRAFTHVSADMRFYNDGGAGEAANLRAERLLPAVQGWSWMELDMNPEVGSLSKWNGRRFRIDITFRVQLPKGPGVHEAFLDGLTLGSVPNGALICDLAHYPSYRKLRLWVSSNAHASAKAAIRGPDGREVWRTDVDLRGGPVDSTFDVPDLPEGWNALTVSSPDGRDVWEYSLYAKHYEWEGNTLGISDKVYPPFTPIVRRGDKVGVVLREYDLDDLGLPRSVTSAGEELLAAPVRLLQGGTPAVADARAKVLTEKPGSLVLSGEGCAGPASVEMKTSVDYDGCIRYDLTLKPTGQEATLGDLALEIPLALEQTRLWHVVRNAIRINIAGELFPRPVLAPLSSLRTPSDRGDNYGTRIRGFIVPPKTGSYSFWLVSDDHSEFCLSTSADPARKERLAFVDGWTAPGEFAEYPSQHSRRAELKAGRRYYFEVLHLEGGGGDHLQVAWDGPGLKRAVIDGAHLRPLADRAAGEAGKVAAAFYDNVRAQTLEEFRAALARADAGGGTPRGVFWVNTDFNWNNPNEHFYGFWVPYVWLGNEDRGLAWFAENDRNWGVDPEGRKPKLSLAVEGDRMVLRVHLIHVPTRIDKPRTITFGLMASPVKPLRDDWRKWVSGRVRFSPIGSQYYGTMGQFNGKYPLNRDYTFLDAARQCRLVNQDLAPKDSKPVYWDRSKIVGPWIARNCPAHWSDEMKERFNVGGFFIQSHDLGNPEYVSSYYEVMWGTSALDEEARTFAWEWCGQYYTWWSTYIRDYAWRDPRDRGGFEHGIPSSACRSLHDFCVWYAAELIKRGTGTYIDNAWGFDKVRNLVTSNAYVADWVDTPPGDLSPLTRNIQPSSETWAIRDYFKRLWVLHHEQGPKETPPLMEMHMTNALVLPILGFNMANLDLEWDDRAVAFQAKYAPDLLRTETLGRHSGNLPFFLANAHGSEKDPNLFAWCLRTRTGGAMVHEARHPQDFSRYDPFVAQLRRFGYDQPDCQVTNYWSAQAPLVSSDPSVKWLLAKRQGRVLLVLCTWNGSDSAPVLTFDARRLGMKVSSVVDAEFPNAARPAGETVDERARARERDKGLSFPPGQRPFVKPDLHPDHVAEWLHRYYAPGRYDFSYQGDPTLDKATGRLRVPLRGYGVRILELE